MKSNNTLQGTGKTRHAFCLRKNRAAYLPAPELNRYAFFSKQLIMEEFLWEHSLASNGLGPLFRTL